MRLPRPVPSQSGSLKANPMPLQSQPAIVSAHARSPACTHVSTYLTARRLVSWSVSIRRQIQRFINSTLAQIAPDTAATPSPERSAAMRPSRPCLPVRCPRLARLLGLVLLAGLSACGSPSPDGPVSSHTSAAPLAARQAPTPMSPLGLTAQPAATAAAKRSPDASRATSPAPATSPADTQPPDEQTTAKQAQQEARQSWLAEMRENLDVTVRLQALEVWAQQPGDDIDSLTYALVDEDDDVRARAEELWEQ